MAKGILLLWACCVILHTNKINAQEPWDIPANETENISYMIFDEDIISEGRGIYENSCTSCHGTPGQSNFTLMVPSPGDPASAKFQDQKDGSLLYKIKKGRGLMPAFEDILSEDEIWSLVAYIRSFKENYVQPLPDLENISIPEYALELDFDDNVDKLVVKVLSEDVPVENASVSSFIKGIFGNLPLGKSKTNYAGIAYFDVDTKMPGDADGHLTVIAKVNKGYGSAKVIGSLKMVEPVGKPSVIEGRHLWSVGKKAPVWLKFTFYTILLGIWGVLLFIMWKLRKIKKVS